ncbi:HAD family hydrolase [Corynebacterium callunae]|uniref:Haloacid dehalogenase superfamily enzyme, subfamily IA n=1 Tax=Corynebacterium callunae DSM 20147 TaxID=1121353 RepID=M1UIZ9_9CORY|nr:HAD-IA family hydrolase [Corynebacterium callunae]AGG65759.1 haloacid dehalogenase superfamily enzyme, subfamily IA [Corynebacterium callunae DSM 20147]
MIKAVIFDLDDTLLSENSYQESANKAVLEFLASTNNIPIEVIKNYSLLASRAPRSQYFQQLLSLLGISPNEDNVVDLISVHRGHLPNISWYPDVIETLNSLRSLGSKLGIITDGYSVAQHQKLNALGAREHFDEIVVSDDLGREFWKPHSKPYVVIAEKLGIEPSEMIYVGDNPEKDFYVSSTLGVTTVRIRRDGSLKADRSYKDGIIEDYSVDSLNLVTPLYEELNSKDAGSLG